MPITNAAERSSEEERIAKYTTQMYRAPEMVDLYSRRVLDEKVDVWVSEWNGAVLVACVCVEGERRAVGTCGWRLKNTAAWRCPTPRYRLFWRDLMAHLCGGMT